MANYQDSLNGAYRQMGNQPMQVQRNSRGGVDANVMGMDGYGDNNYGWVNQSTSAPDLGGAQTNKTSQGLINNNVGKQGNTQTAAPAEYKGQEGGDQWWAKAYQDVQDWQIAPDQQNPDRGAYRDAFQLSMAEKGYDFELTKAMTDNMVGHERGLMGLSADLDRRNTLDVMGAEHGFKIAGMETSSRLSKDYLAAETGSEVRKMQEQGLQGRLSQKEGGFQERENMAEGGFQQRANIRTQGQENRLQTRTTSDEQRRNLTHDRESAVNIARTMSRR